jgi:hypothetical protein
MTESKKLLRTTLEEKIMIIDYFKNSNRPQNETVEHFKDKYAISTSSFSDWLKHEDELRERYLSALNKPTLIAQSVKQSKRKATFKYGAINEEMLNAVNERLNKNLPITEPILREYWSKFAKKYGVTDPKRLDCFSHGWLANFKKKLGLTKLNSKGKCNLKNNDIDNNNNNDNNDDNNNIHAKRKFDQIDSSDNLISPEQIIPTIATTPENRDKTALQYVSVSIVGRPRDTIMLNNHQKMITKPLVTDFNDYNNNINDINNTNYTNNTNNINNSTNTQITNTPLHALEFLDNPIKNKNLTNSKPPSMWDPIIQNDNYNLTNSKYQFNLQSLPNKSDQSNPIRFTTNYNKSPGLGPSSILLNTNNQSDNNTNNNIGVDNNNNNSSNSNSDQPLNSKMTNSNSLLLSRNLDVNRQPYHIIKELGGQNIQNLSSISGLPNISSNLQFNNSNSNSNSNSNNHNNNNNTINNNEHMNNNNNILNNIPNFLNAPIINNPKNNLNNNTNLSNFPNSSEHLSINDMEKLIFIDANRFFRQYKSTEKFKQSKLLFEEFKTQFMADKFDFLQGKNSNFISNENNNN